MYISIELSGGRGTWMLRGLDSVRHWKCSSDVLFHSDTILFFSFLFFPLSHFIPEAFVGFQSVIHFISVMFKNVPISFLEPKVSLVWSTARKPKIPLSVKLAVIWRENQKSLVLKKQMQRLFGTIIDFDIREKKRGGCSTSRKTLQCIHNTVGRS